MAFHALHLWMVNMSHLEYLAQLKLVARDDIHESEPSHPLPAAIELGRRAEVPSNCSIAEPEQCEQMTLASE